MSSSDGSVKILQQTLQVLRRSGWLLVLISVAAAICEQYLTHKMEAELSSMEGASPMVWAYGALQMAISILAPVISSVLVLAALLPKPLMQSMSQHASYVVRETLRAAGQTLSWSLLLILPGLVRFLQFSFVSFIVMLDPQYSLGKKDALRESTRLVNRRFIPVTIILFFFSVVLPLIMTSVDEWALYDLHPISATAISALDTVFSVWLILLLVRQWEKSHGTHVRLETN